MLPPVPSDRRWTPPTIAPFQRAEPAMWLHWLVQLRWVAVAAQAVVIAFTVSAIDRPGWVLPTMASVLLALLATNHLDARRVAETPETVDHSALFVHLWVDLLALTLMLVLSGGPANPFVMLFAVHAAMGALVLRKDSAFLLVLAIVCCFGALHMGSLPLHLDRHPWVTAEGLVAGGRAFAFAATVLSIGGFVSAMSESLHRREAQLREARRRLGDPMTEEVPHPATDEAEV